MTYKYNINSRNEEIDKSWIWKKKENVECLKQSRNLA